MRTKACSTASPTHDTVGKAGEMATGLCRGLLPAAINNTLQSTSALLGAHWLPPAMLPLSRDGSISCKGQLMQQKAAGLDQELTYLQAQPQAQAISSTLVSQLNRLPYPLTRLHAGHHMAGSFAASQTAWSASWVTGSASPAAQWPATTSTTCSPHSSALRQQPLQPQHHPDCASVQQQPIKQQQRHHLQRERQQSPQQKLLEVAQDRLLQQTTSWSQHPAHHSRCLPLPPASTSRDSALHLLTAHALTLTTLPSSLFSQPSVAYPLWPLLAPSWITNLGEVPGGLDSRLPGSGLPGEPSDSPPHSVPGAPGGAQGANVPLSCARGNTYQPSRRKRVNKHGMAKRLSNPKSRAMLLNRIKKGRWRLTVDQFV
ncbi:hypothetical protein QJQ45_014576 [Haematococcus lacustris]|nr:hypothetical protein QJQ45_014576 [Haematococcus lacustris]